MQALQVVLLLPILFQFISHYLSSGCSLYSPTSLLGLDLKVTKVAFDSALNKTQFLCLATLCLAAPGTFTALAPVGFRDNNPLASVPDGLAPASPKGMNYLPRVISRHDSTGCF